MPQTLPWTPWHKVVTLREDVRTGELSPAGSEERAILESLSSHIAARAGIVPPRQARLDM